MNRGLLKKIIVAKPYFMVNNGLSQPYHTLKFKFSAKSPCLDSSDILDGLGGHFKSSIIMPALCMKLCLQSTISHNASEEIDKILAGPYVSLFKGFSTVIKFYLWSTTDRNKVSFIF